MQYSNDLRVQAGEAWEAGAGHDLKDPLLSPVYGDMHGFPPAILTTGTRDLLLSNTVRVHRKLRAAGVDAQLEVYEGQSHAQYQFDDRVPETKEAHSSISISATEAAGWFSWIVQSTSAAKSHCFESNATSGTTWSVSRHLVEPPPTPVVEN